MNRNRVTVRYAKALLELCSEQGTLQAVESNIRLLYTALDQVKCFNMFLVHPGHSPKKKLECIQTIFGPDFNALTNSFISLVFESHREQYLKDICRNFLHMALKSKGIISANLTSAIKLDDETIALIKTKFEQELLTTIELSTNVNPDLLGGFVLTLNGKQYDASLAAKLGSIKKHLLQTY